MNIFKTVDETRDFSVGFELFKQKGQYKVYIPTLDNTETLIKFAEIFMNANKQEEINDKGEYEQVIKDDDANKQLVELITNLDYDNYTKAPKLKLTEATLSNYISEAMLEIMDFVMSNGELNAKLEEMGLSNKQEEIKVTKQNRNDKEVVQQEFKKAMHDNKVQSNVVAIADGKVVEEIDTQEEIAKLKAKIAELEANK